MGISRFKRAVLWTGLTVLGGCRFETDPAKKLPQGSAQQPVMQDFIFENHKGGDVVYVLKAVKVVFKQDQDSAQVDEPRLLVMRPNASGAAKERIRARGRSGTIDFKTKDIELRGDVVYESLERSSVLTTQRLIYWSARKETEVPEGTGYVLTSPTGKVEGSSLISKEDLSG
ncbi:MAG: LPS export ABC transporter periplasmic protein LptC [Elusimicrobiota bacterium]